MKTKFWIPVLIAAATFSASAFAHGDNRERDQRNDRWEDQRYQRHDARLPPPPPFPVQRTQHPAPRNVHYQPAYRPAPIQHVAPPMAHDPRRVVGQAIGAVAGGVIGHQVGNGHIAPTLIGAVIGGVIGNQIAR